jgi:hypothetical protein
MVGGILGDFFIRIASLSSFSLIGSVGGESVRKCDVLVGRLFYGAPCK